MSYSRKDLHKKWSKISSDLLKGKTVAGVRYMTDEEVESFGWYKCAPIVLFTDGSALIPQSDDEGNDSGALFVHTKDKQEVLPTIY